MIHKLASLYSWKLHLYLQALHTNKEFEKALLTAYNDGNTIAHVAAAGGHVSIFKVHQLFLSL